MATPGGAVLRLHEHDDVVVALRELAAGERILGGIACRERIPKGHKVALRELGPGEALRKYGQIIGFAHGRIRLGDWVHTHNLKVASFERAADPGGLPQPALRLPPAERATFQGIVRADGRVATRNYLGVIATVNCSATVTHAIARSIPPEELASFPHVDGVVALAHGTGCGMAGTGEGLEVLQRTLAGYARHPNFSGVLFVGLGCETNQIGTLLERGRAATLPRASERGHSDGRRDRGGHPEGGGGLAGHASRGGSLHAAAVSAERLVLALECGGSDAYSGISANPALGRAADLLVRQGGTVILSETPEIYGAEHLLTRRAVSPAVAGRLLSQIRWWEEYTRRLGGEMDNNPTPGNKTGGLSTILEKSLGAVAKAGTTELVEVYGYGETVSASGLVFMNTPGYDPVSVTGMIAGGANLIAFTTGCGTVCGFKPVPALKLASNSEIYRRLADDMDIDCGPIVEGRAGVAEVGETIFRSLLEIASGQRTRSEQWGFGDQEFVPWQMGPTM